MDIKLDEWEFEFQQRNEHPILMADLWCRALFNNFPREINLLIKGLDYLFTSRSKGYIKKEQKKKILELLKKSCQDEKYLDYLFQATRKRVYELETIVQSITKRISEKTTSEEISALWKELDKKFTDLIPWYYIPYYVIEENILSDRVKEGLSKNKEGVEKITDINNALGILISPIEKLSFQKEQDDFFELVNFASKTKEFEKNSEFIKKSENYLKNYGWTKTFILLPIEPLNFEELLTRIKEAIKNNSFEENNLQKSHLAKNKELAENLLNKLKSNKKLISDIDWARKYAWLLTWSVETTLMASSKLLAFYKLIAKNLKVSYSDWINLTSEEIISALENNSTLSKEEIDKRKKGFVFLIKNGKESLISGEEAKDLVEKIDKNVGAVDTNVKEFKGTPASPGIVRGRVRIAMQPKDSSKIAEGEILVCSMTSPDYVPAMKKASAIITDEGGLLSHAAIVSRELGKPCIVGAKIATKVLKDGDLVEVDADKGIVRILKKG